MRYLLIGAMLYLFALGLLTGLYLEHLHMSGEVAQRNSCIDLFKRAPTWHYTLCNMPADGRI